MFAFPLASVRRDVLLLVLSSGLVFFFQLGAVRLLDVDEAIFSEAAREMFERGDPVAPYYNGELFTHKPPWLYWGMMVGYRLFGCNEFAARCGSALAGLATVLLTYAIGRRMFSARVGFWGGMILGSCFQFALIARAATPDAWLTLFTTLGTFAFAHGLGAVREQAGGAASDGIGPRSILLHALAYTALGFGVLVKGPVALVLPTASWAMFLVSRDVLLGGVGGKGAGRWLGLAAALASPWRWLRAGLAMRPGLAIVLPLAIAGPWFVLVGSRTDWQWPIEFFGVHNFGRLLHPMENHGGPPVYYLIALLVGLFPWSIFLSPMCWRTAQRVSAREVAWQADLLLMCWIGAWVGFFSFAGTKLPSYITPAYPAAALLTARFVVGWIEAPASVARGWLRAGFAVLGAVGIAAAIGLPMAIEHYLSHAWEFGWSLLAAPLLAAALAGWLYSERGQAGRAAWSIAAGAILFLCGVLGLGGARVDDFQFTVPMAERIRAETHGGKPAIISFDYSRPSLVFYARQTIDQVASAGEVVEFFARNRGAAFVITPAPRFDELRPLLPPDVRLLESHPPFLKTGDRLVLVGRSGGAPERAAARDGATRSTERDPRDSDRR